MDTTFDFNGMDKEEFEQEFNRNYETQFKQANDQLEGHILIALVGDVNCGKSSTINKLMNGEIVSTGAKPGETVEIKEIQYTDKIVFVDTPGLDDINKENSQVTLNYYKKSDVILFFTNAAGTVLSENELKNLKEIEKTNKNLIIVLNKIDAAEDIGGLVQYIQQATNYSYPVTPISSRTGENIEMLQKELLKILEEKQKDILMARELKDKSTTANRWINSAGFASAAIGASPIPGSDIIPLTGIQVGLIIKLSMLYNKPVSKESAKELLLATIVGNAGKTAFRQLVKLIPGAGWAVGAGVASAATIALGYAVKYLHEHDIELSAEQLKFVYNTFLEKEKSK
ncbi:GTPase [Exiguobacterium sp. E4787]|uniref:YcjF family protein n=1 Tax=Exiguobacterium sp. E4787 TaxID=2751225 RepID=UPI001BECF662|nr:GTPase [Exiguobacterium sp. E4787]